MRTCADLDRAIGRALVDALISALGPKQGCCNARRPESVVRQGRRRWHLDLTEIRDLVDQYEAMTRGVQQPHPPLWIGGGGERVTLRLVARWGDACNVAGTPDELRHKLEVLRRHCEAVGRDYATIIRSTTVEEGTWQSHPPRVTAIG